MAALECPRFVQRLVDFFVVPMLDYFTIWILLMDVFSQIICLQLLSFVLFFPQGVMMSHRNVLAVVSAVMTIVPALGKKDVYLAYLPLAHILELAAEVGVR